MHNRARLVNPNFFCSFNSLTQCLYNIKPFRELLLESNFSLPDQKPFIFCDPTLLDSNQPEKVARQIQFSKSAHQFSLNYQKIFKQLNDSSKVLDLSDCIEHLVDSIGNPILKHSPADPFVEFLTLISLITDNDRPFYLNQLMPNANKFIQLFSFQMSHAFKDMEQRIFLAASPISSIFDVQISGHFFNFKTKENRSKLYVLHTLPDVLVVRFEINETIQPKKLQKTLDFSNFVFDQTKSNVFRMNSFIMMLNSQHAIAYVRMMETVNHDREKWLMCNDLQIKVLGLEELNRDLQFYGKDKQAILCFYERKVI